MSFQPKSIDVLARYFSSSRIKAFIQEGFDTQSGRRARSPDISQHNFQSPQWLSLPVLADEAEQPVLDRIPFRTPRWIVTDGHCQTKLIAELLLKAELPCPRPAAVAPATICQDEQCACSWILATPFTLPPPRNGVNGELRSIVRHSDVDMALISRGVVDTKRHRSALGRPREVMLVDLFCLPTPRFSLVPEIAY